MTAGIKDYRCGLCGEEFGSNCYPGDISCTGCDARLCPCCGTWFTELGEMSAAPEGHGFLKVSAVARLMSVSGMTVYRLIESGELPAKRFGSSYRVREADLGAYVDGADAVPLEPEVAGG
jgi:excisionase family DNA binding protein